MRSILTGTFLPILCLCTALCAGALPTESAHAQQTTLIHLNPAEALVGEGQTAAVEVRVENVEHLYGLDIRLSFDPAVVKVVDADPAADGIQVGVGDLLNLDFVIRNTADNEEGTIWFALTQVNPSPEVSGSGVAFIVTFAGKSVGSSTPLSITYAKLAKRAGEEIPASTEDGMISVVAPQQAPATPTQAPSPPQPTVVTLTPTASQPTTSATGTPVATATTQPTQQASTDTDTATPASTSPPTQSSPTETPTAPAPTETPAPEQTPVATETQPTPASSSTAVPSSTPTAVSVAEAEAGQAQPTQASPSSSTETSPEASGWTSTLLIVTSIAGVLGAVLLIAGIVGIIRLARQQSR